jgi:RNA polymerase sigma-70 factor (family 1)
MHFNDILLLKLIKDDNEVAFKHLFDSYFVSLCRYANFYLKEEPVSEELVLDIFLYIWENRKYLEIKTSLKSYLIKSVRNKCLNYLRDKKDTLSLDYIETDQWIEDNQSLELDELVQFIEEAITSLPDKCKEVFNKSRFENLSNKEIASQMQISTKTVEAQITKALKVIKKHISRNFLCFLNF